VSILRQVGDHNYIHPRHWTGAILPAWVHIDKGRYVNYAKEFWKSHSDEEMLVFYFYQCLAIKNYVQARLGKDPIFLNTCVNWYRNHDMAEASVLPILKHVWNLLDIKYVNSNPELGYFSDGFVADGHYTETAHIGFAKYIAQKYLNFNG